MNHIEGLAELQAQFRRLGTVPKRVISKAVRPASNIILKDAKQKAPVDTGELKKGLKLKAEKNKGKNKKVFQVRVNANPIFIKISKEGKRAFYPSSQEYGFMARDGSYVPGYNYLRHALRDKQAESTAKMVTTLVSEINKI